MQAKLLFVAQVMFLIATATSTQLDDYDTDVTTEENEDSRQPKEQKLAM